MPQVPAPESLPSAARSSRPVPELIPLQAGAQGTPDLAFDIRPRTYVIQPGGTVEDPRKWTFIRIYPKVEKGAYVVVPYTPDKNDTGVPQPPPEPVDVNQIIESAMIKITGLLTLYILVTRINF